MDATLYIKKDGKIYGPSSKIDIDTLLRSSKILRTDEISQGQSGPWQSISSHEDFKVQVTPFSDLMEATTAHIKPTTEKTETATLNADDISLTGEEFEKYLNELSARGGDWIGFLTFSICVALSAHFLGDAPRWVRLVLFILSIGAAIFAYRKWKIYHRDIIVSKIASFEQPERELESRYNRFRGRRLVWNITTWASIIAIFILFALYRNSDSPFQVLVQSFNSDAACNIIDKSANKDLFIVDDAPDYGWTVSARVQNTGDAGDVQILVKLLSSEGEWKRSRSVYMTAKETKDLNFGFDEPTINATNVRYSVLCLP